MSDWTEHLAKAMCERAGTDWSEASEDPYAPALMNRPFWRQQAQVAMTELSGLFSAANNSSYDLAAEALDEELK